jgi:hypothetical protein
MTRKNDKRKKPHKQHLKMRLTNVKGNPEKQMQLFAEADKHAVLGKYQLAAGVWQHPRTGLWQVWMSTAGSDINWLSAHRDKARADQDVEAYKQFCSTEAMYDSEQCAGFFSKLQQGSDAEPENLSTAEIANITKHIREMVFDIHSIGGQ